MSDIIPGRQTINVGVQNQATGSDDLYTAFTKVETNFENLFANASPYLNITGGTGVLVTNPDSKSVSITNTGVTKLNPGTGISLNRNNGEVTISVNGTLTGVVAGVTNVGIRSTTLNISGSPIISNGTIVIELPSIPTNQGFNPGTYVSPTLTVDQYGRIVSISSIKSVGTVTSVVVQADEGISVTGSPIIDSGTIIVKNTGVTKLTAGPGISLSGNTGAITISGVNQTVGTVTRLDVTSQTLTIAGSPVTSSGTISVNLPNDITVQGNIQGGRLISTGNLSVTGNISGGNITTAGNVTAANLSLTGSLAASSFTGSLTGNVTGNIGLTTAYAGNFTNIGATGNLTVTGNVGGSNLTISTNANVTGNLTSGNASLGNLATANYITINNTATITQNANVTGNIKSGNANLGNLASANYVTINNNLTVSVNASVSGNLTSGNASLGNLVTANYATLSNDASVTGNVTSSATVKGAVVTATTALTGPQVILSTSVPGTVYNGSIAIDAANNRLVVVYGSAIHYINMTA